MNKKNRKKIVIADDHELLRSGLRQVLDQQECYDIYEASNGLEALDLIRKEKPEAAILDIEMPELSGYEVAVKVLSEQENSHIIFLTMHKDEIMLKKALDIGVKGYVLKENTVSEIIQCMESVLKGKHYLSPALSELLIRRHTLPEVNETVQQGLQQLTASEMTILSLLPQMKTSQEMADELNVSVKTIQNHRNNICNKLGLAGRHALLRYALDHKDQF